LQGVIHSISLIFFRLFFFYPFNTHTFGGKFYYLRIMKLSHIEHIGIAVKNMEESIRFYEEVLGLQCYAIEEVKDQKVKTAFFLLGQTKIELLESTDSEGPIGKFIEKRGEGIHHIAFATEGIEGALSELQEKGVQLIDKTPRRGAEGLDIAFLHPKATQGVLMELCENRNMNKH